MKRIRFFAVMLALVMLALLPGCSSVQKETKDGDYKIAVVVAATPLAWTQRTMSGVEAYNKEHGTDYFCDGSIEPDGQAAYLEQVLAEDWDAICVVPFDAEVMAPLLSKARKDGILVITHEGSTLDPDSFDYDIEPFYSEELGRHYGEYLVEKTGGTGTYVQYVSNLNLTTHRIWCDSADAYIAANSGMVKLGRYETQDDITVSYSQTKELLQAHPEITAIQGSASTDIAGAARAVEELGLAGKVTLIGTSTYSISGEYLENGTLETFSLWDSAVAAQAMVALAEKMLSEGDAFDPASCSLPLSGYENMVLEGKVFYGDARVDVTLENKDSYRY